VGASTYHSAALTRGPTMGEAHIPSSSVPAQRVAPDRQLAYTRPTRTVPTPQTSTMAPHEVARPYTPQAAPYVHTRPSSPQAYGRPAPPSTYYSRPAPAEIPRPAAPAPAQVRPASPSFTPAPMARPAPRKTWKR
jgi:hypothetical protein